MKRKRFTTPYGLKKTPFNAVLKWKFSKLFKKEEVMQEHFSLKVERLKSADLQRSEDFLIWLGHATFYLQIDGVRIITDPVFYDLPMFPRLAPLPLDPALLEPDLILISHGHYDHLDLRSLQTLQIYAKNIPVILPLQLSHYLKKGAKSHELDWYEEFIYENLTITALPAAHWHRRGINDFNKALWCSFMIESADKRIFFTGDSALESHFAEIYRKVGPMDLTLMPIGAYLPVEIMRPSHMNPQEALRAAQILGAKEIIPYHYGTFKLSDEPIGEPYRWIKALQESSGEKISVPGIGEVYVLK